MRIYIEHRNINQLLHSWSITESTLVDLIYIDIVEDDKHNKAINIAVDNDISSADEIAGNISYIKDSIKSELLPEIYKYYNRHEDEDIRNYDKVISQSDAYKNLLRKLNHKFKLYLISEKR